MLGTVRSRPRHGTVFFWISSRSPAMPLLHNWKRRKQDWLTHMRGERLRPYRLVVAFMRIAAKRNSRRPRGCHHKRAKKNSRRDYRRSTVADCTISACNIRRLQPLQYRGKKKGGGNETRITISSSNPRLITSTILVAVVGLTVSAYVWLLHYHHHHYHYMLRIFNWEITVFRKWDEYL